MIENETKKRQPWPPRAGYHWKGEPDKRPRCRHIANPSEPWGKRNEYGVITRVTPAAKGCQALAYVEWDGFFTWEKLASLRPA